MVGCFSWWSAPQEDSSKAKPESTIHLESRKKASAVPTVQDYVLEGTTETIKVLKQAVGIVGGVPGAQEVLELALVLIQTCQDLGEIEEKVSELKGYIEKIMIVMIDGITGKNTEDIPPDLLKDIEKLGGDLETVKNDLNEIAAQSRLLVVLFKAANRAKVDRCVELLKHSLTHWDVARDISQGVVLHRIQQGIDRVQNDVAAMQESMGILNRRAHTANRASSRQMPTKPTIFYGRDAFVTDIVNILVGTTTVSDPPRICIHGPGGLGKTSVALAVMQDPQIMRNYDESNRFWVPCVSATSPDLLLQILYYNLRITLDTGDRLADIIAELRSSPSPRLMLLDNFETPWDPIEGKKEDIENILNQLSALSQLSILVTMRTNIPPSDQILWISRPLDTVDAKTSYDIYCTIHPAAKGKPKLDELLVELGHMPFAITLVAQLGKTSRSTPSALLKDWRKHGPGILSSDGEGEDSVSRSISLSVNSKSIIKNVPAHTLLATLSLLPAGTTHNRLNMWTPQLDDKSRRAAISALNNVALIIDTELPTDDDSDVSISVLPVIQSYMKQNDRIPPAVHDAVCEAAYRFILEHKSSIGDPNFKTNLTALSTEETNIQSILLETTQSTTSTPDTRKLDAIIAFSWYQHWTKPRTEVVEYGLRLSRNVGLEPYIAEFLFCLASTLFSLDRYQDACDIYIEAQAYFKRLSNTVRTTECAFELSECYIRMDQHPLAYRILDNISEEDLDVDAYLRARRDRRRGEHQFLDRRPVEALETLNTAKEAFEKIGRQADAARCLRYIARALAAMGKFADAVKTVDQSMDIYEKFGPEIFLVEILCIKGYILICGKAPYNEALSTLQLYLQKAQELGVPSNTAEAFELLGELHVRKRQVRLAIEYYRAAEVEYGHTSLTYRMNRCRDNSSKLELMRSDDPDLEANWNGVTLTSMLLCSPTAT